jgi:WD40 repeat protein
VLTGSEDHTVLIWDLRSHHTLVETKIGSGIPIAISLTPNDEGKKRLSVLTKEKGRTCAQGWQWPQAWNPPFGQTIPERCDDVHLGTTGIPDII